MVDRVGREWKLLTKRENGAGRFGKVNCLVLKKPGVLTVEQLIQVGMYSQRRVSGIYVVLPSMDGVKESGSWSIFLNNPDTYSVVILQLSYVNDSYYYCGYLMYRKRLIFDKGLYEPSNQYLERRTKRKLLQGFCKGDQLVQQNFDRDYCSLEVRYRFH